MTSPIKFIPHVTIKIELAPLDRPGAMSWVVSDNRDGVEDQNQRGFVWLFDAEEEAALRFSYFESKNSEVTVLHEGLDITAKIRSKADVYRRSPQG